MDPLALLLLLLGGSLVPATVVSARAIEAKRWRRSLVAFQLQPPAALTLDEVTAWLSNIAAVTHPSTRFAWLPLPPVCLEVVSTQRGVRFYVLVTKSATAQLLAGIRATMPGCRLTEAPDYLIHRPAFQVAAELTMTSHVRQLAVDRAETASTALLAALQPVTGTSEVVLQWLFTSAGTPVPVPTAQASRDSDAAWSWENTLPKDAEAVQSLRAKHRDALLMMVVRTGVVAPSRAQALALFRRLWNNWHGLNAPGVRLRRRWLPSSIVVERLTRRAMPVLRWPLTLSTREAAGLLALPVGNVRLPGVALGAARQLPPSPRMASAGIEIGLSNYPGMADRALRIRTKDRLRHMHLIGPTGTGKSTLMARLALQDISVGRGVIVIDPKGDLVTAIAERIPAHRRDDVVLLNPAATDRYLIGFNPLNVTDGGERARELVADHVLNIFHSIYRDFWGPRTDDILRAALFTLTHTRAPDGSAFTLIEVPELLTNPALRRYVTAHAGLPQHLRLYWQQFDAMSEEARLQAIGPVLNKLRAFSMRTPVRLLLGQSRGVRIDYRFCRRGILLVSLAKGALGSETANLLGSLFVAALWQATLTRIQLPVDRRSPLFAYLDEFQDVVRLGAATELADMLAQARGLGLGLVLAHQYLNQLPDAIQMAALGTVRTSIVFQTEYADARLLAKRFAPLTPEDLQGLDTYEVAARLCVHGSTAAPVTGITLPLTEATGSADELAELSRSRYGLAREAVEAALQGRVAVSTKATAGRRRRGGSA